MSKTIGQSLFLLLLSSELTAAVHLSETGTGQVAIMPFYTVANDLNSLVTVTNSKDSAKAVKVIIREGQNNTPVYAMNVYLDPFDSWQFVMGKATDSTALLISVTDSSCLLSTIEPEFISITIPVDENQQWQVGSIEILEMGNISQDEGSVFADDTLANQCDALHQAWDHESSDGLWQTDPLAHLEAASGGLEVNAAVIDVASGWAFDVPVLLLADFYDNNTLIHTAPSEATPDLNSGTQDSLLINGGRVWQTTWPTGYEAVSALLMKSTVANHYDMTEGLGALAEWVLSFPTVTFHQNNPDSSKPFLFEANDSFRFPAKDGTAYTYYDRQGQEFVGTYACVLPPPGVPCPPESTLSHAVTTLLVDPYLSTLAPSAIAGPPSDAVLNLNAGHAPLVPDSFHHGKIQLNILADFIDDSNEPIYALINDRGRDTLSNDVHFYHGLPVTGFAVQIYRNANAQPGLLATYASAQAHQGETLITTED